MGDGHGELETCMHALHVCMRSNTTRCLPVALLRIVHACAARVRAQQHDALFATELKKYDALVADIQRNAEAQAEVLGRLAKQNKVFSVLMSDY